MFTLLLVRYGEIVHELVVKGDSLALDAGVVKHKGEFYSFSHKIHGEAKWQFDHVIVCEL